MTVESLRSSQPPSRCPVNGAGAVNTLTISLRVTRIYRLQLPPAAFVVQPPPARWHRLSLVCNRIHEIRIELLMRRAVNFTFRLFQINISTRGE